MDSFFLLRLQRASLFIHLYPERCSGLYSYWGFAPSFSNVISQNYLQLRPVFARNIYCTISWTMFLLRLRPVRAHYRRCCTMPRRWYYLQSCSLHFNKYGWLHISKYGLLHISKDGLLHISKDGLKAQKEYSPEQRSGYSWPSILRSERAKGRRKCADCIQFCWYMGMDSFFLLRLQRASLLMHLYPERCSGLYSCCGFALPLLVTSATQYLGRCSRYGFAPPLLKCKLPKLFAASPRLCPLSSLLHNATLLVLSSVVFIAFQQIRMIAY